MKRAEFIQIAALTPLVSLSLLAEHSKAPAGKSMTGGLKALVIKNRELDRSVDAALDHLGGIGQFVKKKSKVVIKPSMAYNRKPGTGINSDPRLVEHLIRLCYEAGAREVSVFDHTMDEWTLCYKNSGIERVAKNAKARVLPANEFMYYKPLPGISTQQSGFIHIHQAIIQSDVMINVSVSGIHEGREAKGAIENFTRCAWERNIFFADDNQLCNLLSFKKPALNLTEVWAKSTSNNEITAPLTRQHLIASTNMIIADQILASLLLPDCKDVKGLEQAIRLNPGDEQPLPGQVLYID